MEGRRGHCLLFERQALGRNGFRMAVLIGFVFAGIVTACDSDVHEVRIAAQDFRFDPSEIRLAAGKPIRLRIANEGRGTHEFQSPLLSHRDLDDIASSTVLRSDRIPLPPGRAVTLMVQAPPGTYLFHCPIQGHTGMRGTLIVQED